MFQSLFQDRKDRRIIIIYIIWEMCNLIAIQTSYRIFPYVVQCRIMYMAVLVNTAVTLYFFLKYGAKSRSLHNMLALGLTFTAAADYYLTFRSVVLPGYFLFCLVEAIYALYFKPDAGNILMRTFLYGILLAIMYHLGRHALTDALGMLNLILLLVNVFCAWAHQRKDPGTGNLCLALGFSLFAGCDYSLLIRELTSGMANSLSNFMVWIFYVPAQVLLVLAYALLSVNDV